MASFTDDPKALSTFNPYIKELPVDSMVQVGMAKQQAYDTNVAAVQAKVDSLDDIDIANPIGRAYYQKKLNELNSNLKGFMAADFSQNQMAQSAMSLTKIGDDPYIKNAIMSTAKFRKEQAAMEADRKKGELYAANEWHFNQGASKWLGSDNLDNTFNSSYIKGFDINKFVKEQFDTLKPEGVSYDQLFDKNNNLLQIKTTTSDKGVFAPRVEAFLNNVYSDSRVFQQTQIESGYSYKDYSGQEFAQKVYEGNASTIQYYQSLSAEARKVKDTSLEKKYQDKIQELTDYNAKIQTGDIPEDTLKYSFYKQSKQTNYKTMYEYHDRKIEQDLNKVWEFNTEIKYKYDKLSWDKQIDVAKLQVQRERNELLKKAKKPEGSGVITLAKATDTGSETQMDADERQVDSNRQDYVANRTEELGELISKNVLGVKIDDSKFSNMSGPQKNEAYLREFGKQSGLFNPDGSVDMDATINKAFFRAKKLGYKTPKSDESYKKFVKASDMYQQTVNNLGVEVDVTKIPTMEYDGRNLTKSDIVKIKLYEELSNSNIPAHQEAAKKLKIALKNGRDIDVDDLNDTGATRVVSDMLNTYGSIFKVIGKSIIAPFSDSVTYAGIKEDFDKETDRDYNTYSTKNTLKNKVLPDIKLNAQKTNLDSMLTPVSQGYTHTFDLTKKNTAGIVGAINAAVLNRANLANLNGGDSDYIADLGAMPQATAVTVDEINDETGEVTLTLHGKDKDNNVKNVEGIKITRANFNSFAEQVPDFKTIYNRKQQSDNYYNERMNVARVNNFVTNWGDSAKRNKALEAAYPYLIDTADPNKKLTFQDLDGKGDRTRGWYVYLNKNGTVKSEPQKEVTLSGLNDQDWSTLKNDTYIPANILPFYNNEEEDDNTEEEEQ